MITIDEFIEQNKNCLKKGWIAMDEDECWYYFYIKPTAYKLSKIWNDGRHTKQELDVFDIAPIKDWKKSLRKIIPEDENVEIPF